MSAVPTREFQGTQRFAVEHRVGAGGMGVVYRAYDRQRRQHVAVKTLRQLDPAMIYRFKREFRTIADLVHPNLVRLYELHCADDQWFFTMEFVDGVDFLAYVRRGFAGPGAGAHRLPTAIHSCDTISAEPCYPPAISEAESVFSGEVRDATPPPAKAVLGTNVEMQEPPAVAPPQLDRLGTGLRQLAEGLLHLHQMGCLHRDIKPSNVLVTREGRLIVLDFGLVTALEAERESATTQHVIVGTAPYMAPEQAAGQRLTPASDWYSVGVMVYEALTGRCPFSGRALEVLMKKQLSDPAPPRELVPEAPDHWNDLCVGLLERDPQSRLSGPAIIGRLGGAKTSAPAQDVSSPSAHAESPFLGRQRHLAALQDAFDAVAPGRAVVALVRGKSGMGKTVLVRRFLDQFRESDEVVVLAGRCYERESVPFKALDSLADALSHFLLRRPAWQCEAFLPRDAFALGQMFPVLRRVKAVATAPKRGAAVPDRQELRDRAFAALRELLARLADRKRLILSIDDLQWGDLDSVALLGDLLRPPDPPAVLLIVSFRSDDEPASQTLQRMLEISQAAEGAEGRRFIDVGPLSREEARSLARLMLGGDEPSLEAVTESIARESGGSPFFIDALVRYRKTSGEREDHLRPQATPKLDEALWAWMQTLPAPQRSVLEAVSVAGQPIRQNDARQATGMDSGFHEALDLLRAAHLIRFAGGGQCDEIETYHDRIRKAVVTHLSADALARHHLQLAMSLGASGEADPATLAAHYLGAGELAQAGSWYAVAAEQAAEGLAFDRAAELFGLALELGTATVGRGSPLRRKFADALANAGRGAEAGQQYLAAADESPPPEALELRRRAATQFLTSGHIDHGLDGLRTVFAALGMRAPTTPRGALLSYLARRVRLWTRGLGFRERPSSEVSWKESARADACWSAAIGLMPVAPIRGADFQSRGLLHALRCGEPRRIARFLTLGALQSAMVQGERGSRRTQRCLDKARELAKRTGDAHAEAFVRVAEGATACLTARWKHAVTACDEADRLLRDQCTGVAWELDTAHAFALWGLYFAGEIGELVRRVPPLLAEARKRGGRYVLANVNTFVHTVASLAADDPLRAEPVLQEQMRIWSREEFHVQHMPGLYSRVLIETYCGSGQAAWTTMRREYRLWKRPQLLRVQLLRMAMHEARARAAVAAAAQAEDPARFLRSAEQDARRQEREKSRWGAPSAQTVRAGIAMVHGDTVRAAALLRDAIAAFQAADMALHAATARRRLGQLLGGDEGQALIEDADSWMASQRIVNPERMTSLYVPGLPGHRSP